MLTLPEGRALIFYRAAVPTAFRAVKTSTRGIIKIIEKLRSQNKEELGSREVLYRDEWIVLHVFVICFCGSEVCGVSVDGLKKHELYKCK